jgi:hypothetical protein
MAAVVIARTVDGCRLVPQGKSHEQVRREVDSSFADRTSALIDVDA